MLCSRDPPPDDLGNYAVGNYTPTTTPPVVVISVQRHWTILDYVNSGLRPQRFHTGTARIWRCEPAALTTAPKTPAGYPARCLAAVNTDL